MDNYIYIKLQINKINFSKSKETLLINLNRIIFLEYKYSIHKNVISVLLSYLTIFVVTISGVESHSLLGISDFFYWLTVVV